MSDIRAIARDAILAGKLPRRRPQRVSAWQGLGAWCAICDTQVRHDEIEFELEFGPGEDDPHAGSYRVHSRCFEAWELERHSGGEAAVGVPTESKQPRLATQSRSNGEDPGATALRCGEDLSAGKREVTMTGGEWDPEHRGGGA